MYAGETEKQRKPVTVASLLRMKERGEKIACLTAYDFSFAVALDRAGVDVILVGDSLGMVMQGRETTLPVTMENMIYHARCVARAHTAALLMVDMPFMSHYTVAEALHNAGRLMKEGGARMVKLEGTGEQAEIVNQLTVAGIPVCAHLGLRPQAVHKLGGYRVQGREEAAARAMLEDARVLEQAGADMLLLECVPAGLVAEITAATRVPVIGIGAGGECDGQILVLQDMLGLTPGRIPRFSRNFMPEGGSIPGALEAYVAAVRGRTFPAAEHTF
ncbi:3-methyl-2-oxobutanoate hydroxymethyltransferase [Natronocella acetinitrilica]|uniref:3-methyl-2-oxobutanoate hydroxymethyltransferase n=1 Tax=Natronocella acetinitrilica TaxID=414046 RepID=A0AAE3KBR8_9GAMM|nr:3-methyl-2-oxobutanoate hydroxymethyltransferase [Natronocella acetinitrilica]MCP1675004.1 3-methyl-2-oxobutanoate hydroxymethyltransferase [Natronocella acetinitrilica]